MPNFKKTEKDYRQDADKVLEDMQGNKIKNLTPYRKSDNWENIMTGLNTKKDKARYTYFNGYTILDDTTLSEIWIGDGLGYKIVSTRPDDMTREWITILNDPDKKIENEMARLGTQQHVNLALKWCDLFGGSINVLGINDGGKLDEPVKVDRIKSIDWIRTYNRTDTAITEFHFNSDEMSANYGELEYLSILPKYASPYNVHVDRLLIWKGLPVPAKLETGNFYYWGMSILQNIWKQFSNLGASSDHIVSLLYEFVIGKYKIDGLGQLIAENNKKQVEDIMNVIETSKSIINSVLMDSADDFVRDSVNVSGIDSLLDRFMLFVAACTNYPVTKLFGRSAAGMNATGEGDLRNYYDDVRAKQRIRMTDNLLKLATYINSSLNNVISDPQIEYNSLFQQTLKEELECKKMQAEIDAIYIDKGVLTPDEVAENRFGGQGYSYDTTIDLLNREQEPEQIEIEESEEIESEIEEIEELEESEIEEIDE